MGPRELRVHIVDTYRGSFGVILRIMGNALAEMTADSEVSRGGQKRDEDFAAFLSSRVRYL